MRRVAWLPLVLLVVAPAAAQQTGSAMPQAPAAAIDAEAPPAPPMAVRQGDAERLEPPPPAPVAPPPVTGPRSQTVDVGADAPPPENATPRFLFRDVTDRTAPRVKSLPERAAAVESLRRSVKQGGPR